MSKFHVFHAFSVTYSQTTAPPERVRLVRTLLPPRLRGWSQLTAGLRRHLVVCSCTTQDTTCIFSVDLKSLVWILGRCSKYVCEKSVTVHSKQPFESCWGAALGTVLTSSCGMDQGSQVMNSSGIEGLYVCTCDNEVQGSSMLCCLRHGYRAAGHFFFFSTLLSKMMRRGVHETSK